MFGCVQDSSWRISMPHGQCKALSWHSTGFHRVSARCLVQPSSTGLKMSGLQGIIMETSTVGHMKRPARFVTSTTTSTLLAVCRCWASCCLYWWLGALILVDRWRCVYRDKATHWCVLLTIVLGPVILAALLICQEYLAFVLEPLTIASLRLKRETSWWLTSSIFCVLSILHLTQYCASSLAVENRQVKVKCLWHVSTWLNVPVPSTWKQ